MSDRLTDVEQHALLAVWRLSDQAWGANIRDELAKVTGRRLSISAIYVTLVRLEKPHLTTAEMKLNFLRPATREAGPIEAHANVVKRGRTLGVVSVEIAQGGEHVAQGLFTFVFLDDPGDAS